LPDWTNDVENGRRVAAERGTDWIVYEGRGEPYANLDELEKALRPKWKMEQDR